MCRKITKSFLVATIVTVFGLSQALAADPATNPNPNMENPAIQPGAQPLPSMQTGNEAGGRTLLIRSLPSKKIVGSNVHNTKGEQIGTIDDLVIDLKLGKVPYAALSVGGVLGIGDQLFAVPYDEFKTSHDTNNNISFVLDISKDRLENAPGFDKNHCPDFANPQWKSQIDTYYQHSAARSAGGQALPRNR